jgi:ribose transport system ATP-binding protein
MAPSSPPAVVITGLSKSFLSTRALDGVDLTIGRGEIHALVGENGAGKSTLIKILAGLVQPDAGDIRIHGKRVEPHPDTVPIAFVHQDIGLVDDLSIGENVALITGYPRSWGMIAWKDVWAQTQQTYAAMGVEPPDPRAPVGTLSAASKAVLGIVRALSRKVDIVVLDEPTASLPGPDAQHLFEILKRLKASGTSILYVSHRLNELFGLVDHVTVFRDGRHVSSRAIGELTPDDIVRDMLGRDLELHMDVPSTGSVGKPLLEVTDLCVADQGPLSFAIAAGEILGLIGLRGAGYEAVGRAIFGLTRQSAGTVRLAGLEVEPGLSISDRIARGIALLAGDRLRESALTGMSLRENLFPNPPSDHGRLFTPIDRQREARETQGILDRFDVRPRNGAALIDWLSGGNQQKIFVGRWLATGAKVYIMEEPTAGVDIGAKGVIHRILKGLAAEGAAILVVSSDFEEVASLCERALIIGRGAITGELAGASLTLDGLIARSSLSAPALEQVH